MLSTLLFELFDDSWVSNGVVGSQAFAAFDQGNICGCLCMKVVPSLLLALQSLKGLKFVTSIIQLGKLTCFRPLIVTPVNIAVVDRSREGIVQLNFG